MIYVVLSIIIIIAALNNYFTVFYRHCCKYLSCTIWPASNEGDVTALSWII